MSLAFRPIRPEDKAFLCELYASTRREELAQVDWEPAQVEAFLKMQFEAQHTYYEEHYAEADFLIIEEEGDAVGRLYVARWDDEIRIVDIALLPPHRNRGLGSRLLKDLLEEGAAAGLPVRIHVEKFNPALRLYRRLGFTEVKDRGVYLLMEWTPAAVSASGLNTAKAGDEPSVG